MRLGLLPLVLALLLPPSVLARETDADRRAPDTSAYDGPVIDMHLHASHAGDNGPPGSSVCVGAAADLRYDQRKPWPQAFGEMMANPPCEHPIAGTMTDEQNRGDAIAALRRHKATAVLSGSLEDIAYWSSAAPEGTFIPALYFSKSTMAEWPPEKVAAAFDAGQIRLLSEVVLQYDGIFADDPRFDPWLKMAAERGIPVGIHVGVGPPGSPHLFQEYRIQNPMHLEAVLAKYPALRVYAMHAGWPYADDLKALFYAYPQLMVDTAVLQAALTRKEFDAFFKELVEAGFSDRIMFGSDQMNWPGLIDEGIRAINEAPYLTYAQKKAILHDNAARFLRLEE